MANPTIQNPKDAHRPAGKSRDAARATPAPYEPPRIVKRRSVSRATLFSGGGGPDGGGLVGSG